MTDVPAAEIENLRKINEALRLDLEHAKAESAAMFKRIEGARKHLQTPNGVRIDESARLTAEALAACHADLVAAHGALPSDCGLGSIGERIERVVAQRDEARHHAAMADHMNNAARFRLLGDSAEGWLSEAAQRVADERDALKAEVERLRASPSATIEAKDLARQILAITDVTFTTSHARMLALGEVHDLAGKVLRVPPDGNHEEESGTERCLTVLADLVDAIEHALTSDVQAVLDESTWDRENVHAKLAAANRLLGRPS